MSIETFDEGAPMTPHSDGQWVRLDDHNAEIAKLREALEAMVEAFGCNNCSECEDQEVKQARAAMAKAKGAGR